MLVADRASAIDDAAGRKCANAGLIGVVGPGWSSHMQGRERRAMTVAQSLIDTHWVPPAIFALMTLALVLLGLYLVMWATLEGSYLRTLAYVLVVLSFAFAAALGYETAAVATNGFPTISSLAHSAFEGNPITWVVAFTALIFIAGLLATVFTRVAQTSSRLITIQRRLDGPLPPMAWAASLAVGILVVSFVVTRFSSPLAARSGSDPGFSWWVIYLGGITFGVGALLAWALDLRPGALSARMASLAGLVFEPAAPRRGRTTAAARSVVASHGGSIVFFTLAVIALVTFTLFIVAWGVIHGGYLAPLCYALGVMSAALAIALGYQVAVLLRGGTHTIADIADAAFTTHALFWVAAFSVLLFGAGLLATHFTRKANITSSVVTAEKAVAGVTSPVLWAFLLGIVMVAAAYAVNHLTPRIALEITGYSRVSWWVLSTGGAFYAVGALVAWATNWAP
jgi:hypothetical protein